MNLHQAVQTKQRLHTTIHALNMVINLAGRVLTVADLDSEWEASLLPRLRQTFKSFFLVVVAKLAYTFYGPFIQVKEWCHYDIIRGLEVLAPSASL